jgi:polysaccharide export outer membrane protein
MRWLAMLPWLRNCGICILLLIFLASEPAYAQSTESDSGIAKATADNPPAIAKPADNAGLHLGPGDLIEVAVYGIPELSQKVRISSSGDVYLPLVDYVHIGGLTPEEAQGLIEKKLSEGGFVRNPHVTLMVNESASSVVSVLGEVSRPGVYPMLGERRLLDVVSAAGGLTERAGRTITITHRRDQEHRETITLAEELAQSKEGNVPVVAGDTVVVSKAGVCYVVGEVGKPSGFIMDGDSLSVLKAMAMAGGPGRTASLNGATIVRRTPTGVEQIKVPLKKIMTSKVQDISMKPEDILFVPTSGRKLFAQRTVETAFQAAAAVSLVAIRP